MTHYLTKEIMLIALMTESHVSARHVNRMFFTNWAGGLRAHTRPRSETRRIQI